MDVSAKDSWSQQLNQLQSMQQLKVSQKVYAHIALRGDSQGIVGLFSRKNLKPFPSEPKKLIALYNVEKPGNLGAIARTADGLGVEGIILIDSKMNELHHNAVRSSIGALFSVPVIHFSSQEFLEFAAKQKINIMLASGDAKAEIAEISFDSKHVVVLGSEAFGVEGFEREVKRLGSEDKINKFKICLLYTSPSPRDRG